MTQKNLNKKQKALNYLNELQKIRTKHKQLLKWFESECESAGFFKRMKLKHEYKRECDALDHKADAITEKYTQLLKSVKQFTHRDYLKFENGLLDRKFVDSIFKD